MSTENARQQSNKKKQEMDSKGKVETNGKVSKSFHSNETSKNTIKFHSKAKSGSNEAYLSNFQLVPGGLIIDNVPYLTVEHYYQSMKFKDKDRGMFKGLDAEMTSAKMAKSAGGKGAMRKMFGYGLSMLKWKGPSEDNDEDYYCIRVMKKALWERFKQDKRFREIVSQKDVQFEHYEKPRGTFNVNKIPEWGCYMDHKHTGTKRGLNILGNLLNELNAYHECLPNYFEKNGKLNWSGSCDVDGLNWFPYPRNTFGKLRDDDQYGNDYKKCGYVVRDSDVIHPFFDPSAILHA
jgi:predicted NAD-dependent protein-ADP-ribosyltransferase YbiA (DUF1768 family)